MPIEKDEQRRTQANSGIKERLASLISTVRIPPVWLVIVIVALARTAPRIHFLTTLLTFTVIPLAKKLKECGVFGVSSDEYLAYAQANRNEWETRG